MRHKNIAYLRPHRNTVNLHQLSHFRIHAAKSFQYIHVKYRKNYQETDEQGQIPAAGPYEEQNDKTGHRDGTEDSNKR